MAGISILSRLAARLSRSRREQELKEEIEAHIAARRQALIDEGMDPRDAAYEARRVFGNVTTIREEARDMWSVRSIDTIGQDLRYGLRVLRRSPVFAITAVASLALGIGAAVSVFTLADALMVRRLPVRAPEELVLFRWFSGPQMVFESLSGSGEQTSAGFASTSFSKLALDTLQTNLADRVTIFGFADLYRANLAVDGVPESASAQIVSGTYFDALGVAPAAGRLLTPADDRLDAPPAAVLGSEMWVRRFGGSPDVLGRPLVLNGVSFTVAGVLPKGFRGTMQVGQECDVIVPLAFYAPLTHEMGDPKDANHWWVLMMGRLKPGATIETVRPLADAVLKQTVAASKPELAADALPRMSVEDGSRGQSEVRGSLLRPLQIMAGVVAIVLLVACANVANLLLARGKARARELAVRCAIGAARGRIVRQLLTEGLLLGLIASAIGLALAGWMTSALLPALAADSELDLVFGLHGRMVAFTCLLAVVCSVAFALFPALRSADAQITFGLQDSTRGVVSGRRRFSGSGTLVVAQVALSMLLVTAATLLTVSATRLQRINPGFNADNVLVFSVETSLNGYDSARSKAFFDTALDRLRALPGVVGASVSSHRLVANSSWLGSARPAGAPAPLPTSAEAQKFMETHRAYMLQVDEDFVKTMQMSLRRGRSLARGDVEGAPRVAMVNAALARQLFGTEDVVGRRFLVGLSSKTEIEIVGVVANAVYTSIRRQNAPIAYLPFRQSPVRGGTFEIRTAGDPTAITASAREALRAIDPTLPIFNVRTLKEQILHSLRQERLFARLSLMLGALALTLSAMGLYGLLAYTVVRRTAEIGVRIALGAERSAVRWMVLKQSLLLVVLGLAIGIPAARSSTGVLASLLFGLEPNDARVLAAAAAVMFVVAFGAAYIPARRASNIDPLIALRQE